MKPSKVELHLKSFNLCMTAKQEIILRYIQGFKEKYYFIPLQATRGQNIVSSWVMQCFFSCLCILLLHILSAFCASFHLTKFLLSLLLLLYTIFSKIILYLHGRRKQNPRETKILFRNAYQLLKNYTNKYSYELHKIDTFQKEL